MIRSETDWIRSTDPTDVPPYFCTINATDTTYYRRSVSQASTEASAFGNASASVPPA
ncbi:hypothetical protein VFSR5_0527 [Aliivibrio fischeri SR5]|uniref:Uncharacterized protein n=1 Tax=Aliivibrio fischeri SR5 TaxID=1088719 RepID=A0AAV3EX86_ALIFS|nr:hypothetical protein VFSR5_0527 [Aliivibrio fischeri SR5]